MRTMKLHTARLSLLAALFAAVLAFVVATSGGTVISTALAAASRLSVWDTPGRHASSCYVPAVTVLTGTAQWPVFEAPVACRIKALEFIPNSAKSGADTDYFEFNFVNVGASGSGTTATATNVSFTSGVDLTALDAKAFTVSTTDATRTLAAHEVLTLKRTIVGNGLASPSGRVVVEFEPK